MFKEIIALEKKHFCDLLLKIYIFRRSASVWEAWFNVLLISGLFMEFLF